MLLSSTPSLRFPDGLPMYFWMGLSPRTSTCLTSTTFPIGQPVSVKLIKCMTLLTMCLTGIYPRTAITSQKVLTGRYGLQMIGINTS